MDEQTQAPDSAPLISEPIGQKKKSGGSTFLTPLAIVLAGALIAGAVLFSNGGGQVVNAPHNGQAPGNVANVKAPDLKNDHVRGDTKAPITMIEFSDFECPYCASFHPTAVQALAEYDGQVNWVYRHMPLSIHPEAMPAAIASECIADLAGNEAFWEFADALFANQSKLSSTYYEELAAGFDISVDAWTQCMVDQAVADRVAEDANNAIAAGGNGTPFIVVTAPDEKYYVIPGALPITAVRSILDEAVAGL